MELSWRKTKLEVFRIAWRESTLSYRKALKTARSDYFSSLLEENKHNPQYLFNTVTKLTKSKAPTGVGISHEHSSNDFVNVSGYVCNHGSQSGERDTASPRGRYGERRQCDPCLKHTYIKTPLDGRRQPMTSLPARPQYKGRRENTSFASSSEACVRSMAHSLGNAVSRSPLGEPWLHT